VPAPFVIPACPGRQHGDPGSLPKDGQRLDLRNTVNHEPLHLPNIKCLNTSVISYFFLDEKVSKKSRLKSLEGHTLAIRRITLPAPTELRQQ